MQNFDVIVVGASFAGIVCAKEMAERGLSVAVLERKKDVRDHIHTTGILVNEAADLLALPSHLYKEIKQVRLYSASLAFFEIASKEYIFLATDTPELLAFLVEDARLHGVQFFFNTAFDNAMTRDGNVLVNDGAFGCRFLIGADGAKSRVAEVFHLGKNEKFLIGTEFEYENATIDNPYAFYCFLSRKYAPGYIGWAIPGPKVMQVGVAQLYRQKKQSRPDIEGFIAHIKRELHIENATIVEKRGGLIPIGGVVKPLYNDHVMLVGDAAGIVSPLTAGGIHTAIFYGRRLGALTYAYLKEQQAHPGRMLEKEYPRFLHKHLYRYLFHYVPDCFFNILLKLPGFTYVAHMLFFLKKRLPRASVK